MHIRFCPLRMRIIFFSAKFGFAMCKQHVVTYTSYTASQGCIIFKWQVFVNTIKKDDKLKFQWFWQPKSHYCALKCIIFVHCNAFDNFFAKFGFAMCRQHVLTYTSFTTSQPCVIFVSPELSSVRDYVITHSVRSKGVFINTLVGGWAIENFCRQTFLTPLRKPPKLFETPPPIAACIILLSSTPIYLLCTTGVPVLLVTLNWFCKLSLPSWTNL